MIFSKDPVGGCSRRDFLATTGLAAASTLLSNTAVAALPPPSRPVRVVIFSKIYQSLKLTFTQAAELTAEAGLDGVDCPVRPGGEVLPERVADDLPKYVAALRAKRLAMPLIVTGITGLDSPHAHEVLRTAKTLGIKHYRIGFQREKPIENQMRELKARLRELGEFNRELGLTGLCQNHSESGKPSFGGGDLNQLWEIVHDLDPAQIGVAFDIAHALVVHGPGWLPLFRKLQPWVKIVYIKDVKLPSRWVPIGQGEIHGTGYFRLLKEMNYAAPISMHLEYDWDDHGSKRNRETLLKNLKTDQEQLRRWL
jgi:sugar phosphate isomerase/epimerase